MSKIAGLEVIPLASPVQTADDLDGTTETVLVRVLDEDGRFGIGETDAPAAVVKGFLEMPTAHLWSRNMSEVLIGSDPIELAAIWQRMYEGVFWPGRRGLGVHALSAVDVALHDLAGKQHGVPAYKLMGGARRERLRPYCTIYPGLPRGRTIATLMGEICGQFEAALEAGYRAVKMEVLFFDLVTDMELVELIRQGRRVLGDGIQMALDFGYRWTNWHDARRVLDRVADSDIFFAEATLQHDDLDGHARLAEGSPIRICGAEAAATRWEIREWLERGKVGVVQPNITRGGGLTEIRRIAELCELHGAEVVPHGWKTGITAAAGQHFQAACPAAPLFEVVSPHVYDSLLRRELVSPEPDVVDGTMALPEAPGLGIELNEELVERLRTDRPAAR
ncbi:MAG: Mandelate racemase/muconate lactonizing protein [Rhodospirillales bacterium]|jgi:L-alanine-DL-glutamate epimerase-like enolase superfamily enzyme|nr:Mandelate racemase/muconate lactonizing protein [Rhodospirillales bacterium]